MRKNTSPIQKTILCVDDDASMRSALCRLLTPLGHRILTASDGAQALEAAEDRQPDLIVLDLMMPGMDGYQLLKALRQRGLTDTPVVMLTGRDSGEDMISGYEGGAVYYITKPFKNEYVLNVVEYLIGDLAEEEREWLEQKL